jgi:predicted TIM-barrel fold metal-dependent hydrolase
MLAAQQRRDPSMSTAVVDIKMTGCGGPADPRADQADVWSRRDAVRALAVVIGGGPALRGGWLDSRAPQEARRVDVHHHFFPPQAKQRYGPLPAIQDYSPSRSLESMDRAGVETALLSLPIRLGDDRAEIGEEGAVFAREVNEYAARVASDHRGRFGFFAFLPMPDIDATLREIEHALDSLGASGVGFLSSYGNRWLGNEEFRPVFDELNRREALVYTHPYDAPCCRQLLPNTLPQTVEWNTDTSRAIWSLINDGEERPGTTVPMTSAATRYADVRFIWSHAGGTLLGLVGRFLGGERGPSIELPATPEANSRLYHLRRFYYDTAGSANAIQMPALASFVGASQIVLGSDFPFLSTEETIEALHAAGLDPADVGRIERENALRALSA